MGEKKVSGKVETLGGEKTGRKAETLGKAKASEKAEAQGKKKAKAESKKRQIAGLIVALVVVLGGGVLFVGAASGWFEDAKVELSSEYYCEGCDGELMDLTVEEYEQLVEEKKSFAVMIDQGGCTTAERLKGYAQDFAKEEGMKFYRMMFSEMKKTSLYEKVKYYPSFVVVNKGRVWTYLRADANEDAGMYNFYEMFRDWAKEYLLGVVEKSEKM